MSLTETPKPMGTKILEILKFVARLPLAVLAIVFVLLFSYITLMLTLKIFVFIIENVIERPW